MIIYFCGTYCNFFSCQTTSKLIYGIFATICFSDDNMTDLFRLTKNDYSTYESIRGTLKTRFLENLIATESLNPIGLCEKCTQFFCSIFQIRIYIIPRL